MNSLIRLRWREVPETATRREVAWGLLHEELGGGIRLSNPCPRCGAAHGPVQIEGAAVTASVTYAAGWAVVALAPADAGVVGVDAEAERDARRDEVGLTGVLGAGDDTPSLREWVRVEAALKADRRGLRVEPGLVRVRDARQEAEAPETDPPQWRAVVPGRGLPLAGWDFPGPPGVIVSVALARP